MSLFSKPIAYIFRVFVFIERTNIFLNICCQCITTTTGIYAYWALMFCDYTVILFLSILILVGNKIGDES